MTKKTSQFDQLVDELDLLAKALPAESGEGGSATQAAAGGGGGEGGDDETDEQRAAALAAAAKKEGGESGDPMAKSFKVKLPDGTEVDAMDGAEMVKSLTGQLSSLEEGVGKTLAAVVGVMKKQGETLNAMATMTKSLQEDLAKLGGQGAGRKAVLTVAEKPDPTQMAKSTPQGMGANEFMAKANEAWKAGRLSGDEISLVETYVNRSEQPPESIVRKVISA